ncbi:PAS and helix-turn-helix domain-containing protein [Pseudooceanicola aestuarii]|uniref:PAS and helix-turn-helix domain-containing protein n=1 Tax=Pseudooceanicola aestuarii TaxID=2697319 RepID=UPI0013D15162|nr:PAS and helix-turn-helix domain-containing protein [Pseudooceanicola aestuarii]
MDDLAAEAFEQAPIGLALTRHRQIDRCNGAFTALFGYAAGALEGRSMARLYPSAREYAEIGEIVLPQIRETGVHHDERIMKRADDSLFWCRAQGRTLTPQDPFARCIWCFSDLSAQRPVVDLTVRERQVAMLMVEGLTAKEIARRLSLSHRTVEAHRGRMMQKLSARGTADLIARLTGFPDLRDPG